jgi:hypothetical protein
VVSDQSGPSISLGATADLFGNPNGINEAPNHLAAVTGLAAVIDAFLAVGACVRPSVSLCQSL